MSTIADLVAKLTLDNSSFVNGIQESQTKLQGLGKSVSAGMKNIGSSMIKTGGMISLAAAPVALFYKSAIQGASDMGEQQAKTNQIFGESAKIINDWKDTTTEAFGIGKLESLEYAGNFGNILTTMGLVREEAANMSKGLIELAADQAAFNNIPTADVLSKIESGLTGMYRPLRSLGIVINEAMVQAKAMEMGLADANGELSTSALVQARVALITEQSANATGQFARESEGLAAQTKITQAKFADLKAELGKKLLPIALKVAKFASDLIEKFGKLSPTMQNVILVLGGLFVALGPVLVVLGSLISVVGTIIGVFTGPAVAAIIGFIAPFLPVIAIIAAVIAVVALLKKAWDEDFLGIQTKTREVLDNIKAWFEEFSIEELVAKFTELKDMISETWNTMWEDLKLKADESLLSLNDRLSLWKENTATSWAEHYENVTTKAVEFWENFKILFGASLDFIKSLQTVYHLAVKGEWAQAGIELKKSIGTWWEEVKTIFDGALGNIVQKFANINWSQLGADIINGVKAGVLGAAQALYDAVAGVIAGALAAARGALQAKSPSKVFMKLGESIPEGLALGIKAKIDLPEEELKIPALMLPGRAERKTEESIVEENPLTALDIATAVTDALLQSGMVG